MTHITNIRDHLLGVLEKAQEQRGKLAGRVDSEHDRFPIERWILHERKTMHDEVNLERSKVGKAPVPIEAVVRVERMAVGHSDFSSKFALYCAELVVHDPEPQS